MKLSDVAKEIRDIISEKQKEFQLTFEEESHKYTMLDKDGNPIFDRNNSGGIDLADLTYVKPLSDTTTFMSAAVPVLKDLMYPGATAATTTATTTTPVTVVTNADNSQRNNQSINTYYAGTLSKTKNPIKDAMLQTGLPA